MRTPRNLRYNSCLHEILRCNWVQKRFLETVCVYERERALWHLVIQFVLVFEKSWNMLCLSDLEIHLESLRSWDTFYVLKRSLWTTFVFERSRDAVCAYEKSWDIVCGLMRSWNTVCFWELESKLRYSHFLILLYFVFTWSLTKEQMSSHQPHMTGNTPTSMTTSNITLTTT